MVADQREWPQPVGGGSHHMGTTRMSDNPLRGVVDRNCKVHAVDNLYVAGSSVFPTSGASNPTLTLVALTLRLADHLKGRIR
jgi:choline dehydrogenase-like flavoprotein